MVGVAIGTALVKLPGDTVSGDTEGGSLGPPSNSPGASSPATTTAATKITTATTPADKRPASTPARKPATDVRVRIVSAILHPATLASGKRRNRARLSVHVRVTNRGGRRISPARPLLVSGDARVRTDPNQDTAETYLGALYPGDTTDVTLRFEIAGAVTRRVQQELHARLIIAGRKTAATVKVGHPVSNPASERQRPSSGTTTTQRPPPPPPLAGQSKSRKG